MRFNWMGALLAPLPVPLLFSAGLLIIGLFGANPGRGLDGAMLLFAVALTASGCIAYGTTLFVFLPCLFVLSLFWTMNYLRAGLLGMALGAAVILPLSWIAWRSGGPDSGPPEDRFSTFFLRSIIDPEFWLYAGILPLAGLITAWLYWWLCRPRHDRPRESV